jgi:hypothetical protein
MDSVTVFTRGKEVRVYRGPVETPPGWQRFSEVPIQEAPPPESEPDE